MMRQLFENSSTILPVAGLLFFFVLFVAAVARAASRGRRAHYDHMAHLPLEREEDAR